MYIQQEDWQKELLVRDGNTVTLMDEYIREALSVLKSWNPTWEPKFYLTDYSDAEIAAITKVFPNTQVYLCEFHREQAWERWVKERKHGLSDIQAATLLDLLRDCANAPPNHNCPDKPYDQHYQHAVGQRKAADVWVGNLNVQQWLQNKWLCCPKVCRIQLRNLSNTQWDNNAYMCSFVVWNACS